jgi:O-antigen ligase
MKKREKKSISGILYGLSFITPVSYSVVFQEMDNLQKLIFLNLALLLFLGIINSYKSEKKISLDKYILLAIIIFPVSFITAFVNGSASNLPLLLTNLLVPLCIIMLTVFMMLIFGEEKFFKTVSFLVVIISSLFGFIGLLEVFKINVIPLPTVIPPGSTIGHRSFAVEYLLPSLPFILILKSYIKKKFYPLLLFSAFINVSFILFTRSRSAMLVLGIITLLYLIYSFSTKNKSIKKLIPVAAVYLFAFVFSLLPAQGAERTDLKEAAESMFDTQFRSNRLRITYWDASFQMIAENPFVGVGLFKWSGYYPKYFGEEFNDKTIFFMQSTHAHNDFLELFAENGIISPLIYLLIILLILKIILSKSKIDSKYYYVFLCALSTALFSLVAFPLHKFSSHFLLSVCAGIALFGVKADKKKKLSFKISHLKIIFIALLLVGIISSYIKLQSELNYIKAVYFKKIKSYGEMNEKLNKVSSILYPYNPPKQPIDYYRGIVSSNMKNYPEALKYSLHAEELAPFSPVILYSVAAAYQSMGNTKEAIDRLKSLKEIFPDYSDPQMKLLYLYAEEKDTDKGRKLLTELLVKFPDHAILLELKKRTFPEE